MTKTKIDSSGVTFPDASVQAIAATPGYKVVKVTVNYDDSSPVTVFTLKAGSFVAYAQVNITTGFVGTAPTLDLGYAADTDGLIPAATIDCANTGWKVGGPGALGAFFYDATLHYYPQQLSSDTDIIVTIGGTGLSAGVAVFYIIWVDLSIA